MIAIQGEYITLQQLLKYCGITSTGGEAKLMIQAGKVMVNGETETRRGRKLYPGDKVTYQGKTYEIG